MKIKLAITAGKKDPQRQPVGSIGLIDCGQVRKRTKGLPAGFVSEAGFPPFIRFLL